MGMIEMPVGMKFQAMVDGEYVTVVVEKGNGCSECIYSKGNIMCAAIACEAVERKDSTNVIIKKMEGGNE